MKWLNETDLRITSEDPENKVTFRQVGWLGFSGKYYARGEEIREPAGFSPVYIQLGDYND